MPKKEVWVLSQSKIMNAPVKGQFATEFSWVLLPSVKLRRGLYLLLLLVFFCHSNNSFAASIRGKVEGPRGVLVGAEVTLLREGFQVHVASTDSQGGVLFENLPAGTYRLQVVLSPYLPVVKEVAVSNTAQEVVEVAITLESLNETVTVTAGRLPVPVATSISNVKILPREELQKMPYQALDDRLRAFPEFSLFRRSSSLVSHPTTQGVSLRGIGPAGSVAPWSWWTGYRSMMPLAAGCIGTASLS